VSPPGVGDYLGEAEDLGCEVLVHEDVTGFDLPVDDGWVGQLVEPVSDLSALSLARFIYYESRHKLSCVGRQAIKTLTSNTNCQYIFLIKQRNTTDIIMGS
jgi:hypothetical protein